MANADAVREERMMYGDNPLTADELNEKYPNRPHNHSKTLPFAELFRAIFNPLAENRERAKAPRTLAKIKVGGTKTAHPNEQRSQIIERFVSRWRKEVGNDFYPAMRLLIPDKDRDRSLYGMKESVLGKLLVKVMKINKDSEDGYGLMHWKLPGANSSKTAGDFAGRCAEVLAKRPMLTSPGTMTIAEVNAMLDRLSVATKEENQLPILEELYTKMNPEELQWLIRMILKQMKIGTSEKTIFEVWHPDAENLFNISSSLKRVCWELYDPTTRLAGDDKGIQLMQCFAPQLAAFKLRSIEQTVKRMHLPEDDPVFWIEEKLDGERMQLHMLADNTHPGGMRFCFWSRKAKDYTYLYGNSFEDDNSALTRHLRTAFHEGVRNIILDGEMITWDAAEDKVVSFGTLKSAAKLEQGNPYSTGNRPLFRVFDCLYLNDRDLTQHTLRIRRQALVRSIKDVHRRLEIHPYVEARNAAAVESELRRVVAEASEGLVVKNPRSAYKLNVRNEDWIKVKPEYMSEFGEALDCVVIGGYYGSGHRGGGLSSFLCGLRVDEEHIENGANPQKCYSFFKVGGGFSASDYADIRHRTDGKWKVWDSKKPPSDYVVLGGGVERQYEKPDVWILPQDSFVVEVKAASVGESDQFALSKTLRFPRFKRIREDKDWKQALSIAEFHALKETAQAERDEKLFQIDDERKQRRATKRKRPLTVQGCDAEVMPISTPSTEIFAGKSFMVLSEAKPPFKKSKLEIETLIKTNGGTVVASDRVPGTIVIADKNVVKAASISKRGDRNIVKPKWLFDCAAQQERLPYEPDHLLFTTADDAEKFQRNVDQFDDSYCRATTIDEMQNTLKKMRLDDTYQDVVNMLADEEFDVISMAGFFFASVVAFFDFANKDLAAHVEFASGTVAASLDDAYTHIVVENDSPRLKELKQAAASGRVMKRLVTPAWIMDSWRARTRLDEEHYAPG